MKFILIDGEEIAVKEEDINSLEKLQSLVGGGEKEAYLQVLREEYSDRAIAVWCDEDGGSSSNNWGLVSSIKKKNSVIAILTYLVTL